MDLLDEYEELIHKASLSIVYIDQDKMGYGRYEISDGTLVTLVWCGHMNDTGMPLYLVRYEHGDNVETRTMAIKEGKTLEDRILETYDIVKNGPQEKPAAASNGFGKPPSFLQKVLSYITRRGETK